MIIGLLTRIVDFYLATQINIEIMNFFTDEEILTHCLLRCKNSMEKCKIVLEAYYTLKSAMPEIYDNRDPYQPNIEQCMKGM